MRRIMLDTITLTWYCRDPMGRGKKERRIGHPTLVWVRSCRRKAILRLLVGTDMYIPQPTMIPSYVVPVLGPLLGAIKCTAGSNSSSRSNSFAATTAQCTARLDEGARIGNYALIGSGVQKPGSGQQSYNRSVRTQPVC